FSIGAVSCRLVWPSPCSASLRLLCPSPARRSSDLGVQARVFVGELGQRIHAGVFELGQFARAFYQLNNWVLATEFSELFLAGTVDRKSTRLNSSHVKTSYAVFCLKSQTRGSVRLNR